MNRGRARLFLAFIAAFLVCLPLYFVVTRFVRYQPAVDRIVASVPREDRTVSPEAMQVFRTIDGEAMPWLVTKSLLRQIDPKRVNNLEWHSRGLVWQYLLPIRLGPSDLEALYCHYMQFEEGSGIQFGAARYFGKKPSELTRLEAIQLVVITRAPRRTHPRSSQPGLHQKWSE